MGGGGGCLCTVQINVALDGSFIMFRRNSATLGGALHIGKESRHGWHSYLISSAENLYFTGKVARDSGGTIILEHGSLNLGTEHRVWNTKLVLYTEH